MTRSAWLLGSPVGHSLSPAIHRAAYRELGLDCTYLCAEVKAAELPPVLDGLRHLGVLGVNLTIPLKQAVLPLLHRLEEPARRVGAVNCLRLEPGGWAGNNTDAAGWLDAFDLEVGQPLKGRPVIVLGAGGAARAVVWASLGAGAEPVTVVNRDPARAQALARDFPIKVGAWPGALTDAAVVVNCTPVGTAPHIHDVPVLWPQRLPPGVVACDLIYNPRRTRFLRDAAARGAVTQGGLGMLVHQARRAIQWWSGQLPEAAPLRRAAERALRRQRSLFSHS